MKNNISNNNKKQSAEQTAYMKALRGKDLGTLEKMERRPAWFKVREQEKL